MSEEQSPETPETVNFRAFIKNASIDNRGELTITLVVAREDKYAALKVTDETSTFHKFAVEITSPKKIKAINWLEGFQMPEGGMLGDGRGKAQSRGGKRESKDLWKDKV